MEEREEFRMGKEREGKTKWRGEGMCSERVCSKCEEGEESGEWVQDKKMIMVSNFLPFHSLQLTCKKIKLHYIIIFYFKMNNYF